MTDVTSYKLGRLPAQFPGILRDLTYYVAGDLPAPPPKLEAPDFAYGMLGNDRYGDCGVAGFVHGDEAIACMIHGVEAAGALSWPSEQQVIDGYLKYTNGQDSGVVLSAFLQYVRTSGFYDKTVSAYAPVKVADVPTIRTATWLYGFTYTGIRVYSGMQTASQAQQPWTVDQLNTPLAGGHCVPVVGYDDNYIYCVTWGMVQPISWPMWHAIADEAWAVITDQAIAANGDGHGVVLSALEADLNQLH